MLRILKEFLTLQEYCTRSLPEMITFNIKFFLSKLNNEGQDGVGGGGGVAGGVHRGNMKFFSKIGKFQAD